MNSKKAGLLLHITSLPSKYGVGTLGKACYDLIDFMHEAKLKIWQILPITPTGYGDSPYQSFAATALNYYMIDLEELIADGLLNKEEVENVDFGDGIRVDFSKQYNNKISLLRCAFEKFNKNDNEFKRFIEEKEYNDFALFMTLKKKFMNKAWYEWPNEYKYYSLDCEKNAIAENYDEYLFWLWTQFVFVNQWKRVKAYAVLKGVEIMGDIPLYIAYDSVEVWKYPKIFMLNDKLEMTKVAGCPPDCFSADGQLWGNPVYNWTYMKNDGYSWWKKRIYHTMKFVDILRIDHFRGFDRFFAIDSNETTARYGSWIDGPKFDLFKDMLDLNIVAEDLGVIDDGVIKLMNDVKYPGMKILEFAFDGNPKNEHKPSNYTSNYVAYTGTHDNMPLLQYVMDLSEKEKPIYFNDLENELSKYKIKLNSHNPKDVVWAIIELGFSSLAKMVIIPVQDYLCQDGSSRMNLPSQVSTSNWSYRIENNSLNEELKEKIKRLVNKYNR